MIFVILCIGKTLTGEKNVFCSWAESQKKLYFFFVKKANHFLFCFWSTSSSPSSSDQMIYRIQTTHVVVGVWIYAKTSAIDPVLNNYRLGNGNVSVSIYNCTFLFDSPGLASTFQIPLRWYCPFWHVVFDVPPPCSYPHRHIHTWDNGNVMSCCRLASWHSSRCNPTGHNWPYCETDGNPHPSASPNVRVVLISIKIVIVSTDWQMHTCVLYETGLVTERISTILRQRQSLHWWWSCFIYLSHAMKMSLVFPVHTTGKTTVLIEAESQITTWISFH